MKCPVFCSLQFCILLYNSLSFHRSDKNEGYLTGDIYKGMTMVEQFCIYKLVRFAIRHMLL